MIINHFKQNTKPSKVLSEIVISSSVGEDDSMSFEGENNSLYSTELVKDKMKKHALTTKENYA
jgi:hypothetical protein